ncbi:MAG TPA: sugar phosphate isomerase/epimerase family protein [Bryobacteraceae bacterium]|nr:sugar phosphate isomerase/epimerase family protein [Bryobacteraceae bacterium]
MQALQDLEPGVMLWAERDNLAQIKSLGVRSGQLGLAENVALTDTVKQEWKSALGREQFTLITLFCAYEGENYADIPTVQRTVGFIPRASRERREKWTLAVSDFAAELGVGSIACHVGFVPPDEQDPDYIAVRAMVRRICDHAARHGQTFALETGQEPAQVLLHFLKDVDRGNLRINFDPANMILYGTGDPIEALDVLGPHVISVHAKDGDWPPKDKPEALGTERPLGQGAVGIEKFVRKLKQVGYRGTLNVEREIENQEERLRDIRAAVGLLKKLTGAA